MNTKIRYDLDSLELANGDFGYPITEKEVQKVNRMLELMENVRSRQMYPTEGDCVEFVTRSGDYFGKAHIERITGKYADICLIPETVFCFDGMGKAAYDTTGSPWTQVNIRNMKPAGTEIRIFRTWDSGSAAIRVVSGSTLRSGNGNTENRIRCMTVTPPVTGSAIIS